MYTKGKIIGALQLIVVGLEYETWASIIVSLLDEAFLLTVTGMFILTLGIAFLALPIVGLLALFKQKRWGHLSLAGFPVIAHTFGLTAVPFPSFFYGVNQTTNLVLITLVNLVIIAACIWLYIKGRA